MKYLKMILVLALTLTVCSFAQAATKPQKLGKAGTVVQKFCQADAEGARLSSDTYQRVQNLVTWEDEPGWDMAVIIKGFQVIQEAYSQKTAEVTVGYDIHQKQNGDGSWQVVNETEEVVFHLILAKGGHGGWKIESPQFEPHILKLP